MAERSTSYDGDRQGDGWGIAWLDPEDRWQRYTSLSPVWEEGRRFPDFPDSTVFAIHARSASFPHQKGVLEFNQPYVDEDHAFVFNGLLRGVSLTAPGGIGAQKVWSLLKNQLQHMPAAAALRKTREILTNNSREIRALNIGLAGRHGIDTLCSYMCHPEYYRLHRAETNELSIICSEPLPGYGFGGSDAWIEGQTSSHHGRRRGYRHGDSKTLSGRGIGSSGSGS